MPGVLVTSGVDLRISNISISFNTGEIPPVTVEVRLDMWNHWLLVAIQSCECAEEALTKVQRAKESGDQESLVSALEEEFRHGMVAISAAAFAVDSLYASVKERHGEHPQAKEWQANRLARYKQVAETFRWAWNIRPASSASLRKAVGQLFKARDLAVHAPVNFREPIERADIDCRVEWRFVQYRAENVRAAITIASDIIEALLRNSTKAPPALREWVVASRIHFENATGHPVRDVVDDPPTVISP